MRTNNMWHFEGLVTCFVAAAYLIEVVTSHRSQDLSTGSVGIRTAATSSNRNYLEDGRPGQLLHQQQPLLDNRHHHVGSSSAAAAGGRSLQYSPEFVTLGQKYSVAIGSTIVLPCKINESESASQYVLAWKHDIAVLTAGDVKVTMNPRIRLMPAQHPHQQSQLQQQQQQLQQHHPSYRTSHSSSIMHINMPSLSSSASSTSSSSSSMSSLHSNSYNLEIQSVHPDDAGAYACQIGTLVPKEIVHSLEVLVPPKINYLAPSTKLDVPKGASIKLECKASGNPAPAIIWSRKNNVMPNGEANITNNVLEMMHADRHTVGHYKCTADNRVGQPDQRDIFVNVLYGPEIEVEIPFVHSGVGYDTQLVCTVHAEPTPKVVWYKQSTQLGVTEQHSQQNHGNRYMLIIRNVTVSDLGNYSCQAANYYGKESAMLTLSGIPSMCEFVNSPRVSPFHDQYNISWTVQSYAPILEYRLYHRRQGNNSNRIQYGGKKQQQQQYHHYVPAHQYQLAADPNSQHDGTPDWEDVVIIPQSRYYGSGVGAGMGGGDHHQPLYPVGGSGGMTGGSAMGGGMASQPQQRGPTQFQGNSNTGRHKTSYLITNLRSASNYEVRVQARNVHGWNKLSATFYFSTPAFEVDDNAIPNGADFRPLTQQSSSSSNASASAVKLSTPLQSFGPVVLMLVASASIVFGGGRLVELGGGRRLGQLIVLHHQQHGCN